MTDIPATPAGTPAGVAARGHSGIIATLTNNESACIMCEACGHVFADSIPFAEQSEAVDNTVLARALFYHMCDLPQRNPRRRQANAQNRRT